MKALTFGQTDHAAGGWRVWAQTPGQERMEVSRFRNADTEVNEIGDESPFAWEGAEIRFPDVTVLDRVGRGALAWLSKDTNIDIEWTGDLPEAYPYDAFVFEGFAVAFSYRSDGLTVTLKGAMRQLDGFQAKPEHLAQPLTYEYALRRAFENKPSLRVTPPNIVWPDWWTQIYHPEPRRNGAFIPSGVKEGDKWTAMLTRSTGNWEAALSSYCQTLLSSMWTSRGRWTLDLLPGRITTLQHLDFKTAPDAATVVLDPLSPDVDCDLTEDWENSANVWYGQGKSRQGVGYSGMVVSGDGQRTTYKPLAASRQVEPVTDYNGWLKTETIRREALLQNLEGLDQAAAEAAGGYQLAHFGEPGVTGTITLSGDVVLFGGEALSMFCIRAGMTTVVPGALGSADGLLLHVVKVGRQLLDGKVILTVDSKQRDALTISQIAERGRDALNVPRLLIGGQYQPALPDQLVPWSYSEGSGYIPSSPGYSSLRLFDGMPDDIAFPWVEWTTERPPSQRAWRSAYIGIGPKKTKADDNWAFLAARGGGKYGFPIRMAQAGRIRLVQIAAYDFDGNVLPVPFHVSLYSSNGVNVSAMPKIPAGGADGYLVGERYPFFQGAWERYGADGVEISTENTVAVSSAGLVRGWGTGKVKAGYWPGSAGSHEPTGLLVDTEPFDIQVPVGDGTGDWGVNPYSERQAATYAGFMYLMVYCDAQLDQSAFFLGRMFRDEPGQGE